MNKLILSQFSSTPNKKSKNLKFIHICDHLIKKNQLNQSPEIYITYCFILSKIEYVKKNKDFRFFRKKETWCSFPFHKFQKELAIFTQKFFSQHFPNGFTEYRLKKSIKYLLENGYVTKERLGPLNSKYIHDRARLWYKVSKYMTIESDFFDFDDDHQNNDQNNNSSIVITNTESQILREWNQCSKQNWSKYDQSVFLNKKIQGMLKKVLRKVPLEGLLRAIQGYKSLVKSSWYKGKPKTFYRYLYEISHGIGKLYARFLTIVDEYKGFIGRVGQTPQKVLDEIKKIPKDKVKVVDMRQNADILGSLILNL